LEKFMLNVTVEKIGKVAVLHCEGRIVQSDAAFRLRDAVTQQSRSSVVLLDFSGVKALEGGGLGMLLFLQMWTRAHGIQFKVFDPPIGIRQSLERISSAATVEITGTGEVLSLLGWGPENLWQSAGSAA
jgi:anti-anti-sigma regulatory factor